MDSVWIDSGMRDVSAEAADLSRLRGLLEVAVLVAGRVLGRRGILGGLAGIVRAVDGVVVGEDHRHAAVALRAFLQLVAGQPGTAVLAGAAVVLRTVGRRRGDMAGLDPRRSQAARATTTHKAKQARGWRCFIGVLRSRWRAAPPVDGRIGDRP